MRFFHVVLAATVTLLASANAVSTEQNHVSQTAPELVTRSLDNADVKRNLRKYVEDEDSLDSLDSLDSVDETEERVAKISLGQLKKLAHAKTGGLPVGFANLSPKLQKNFMKVWSKQNRSLKHFANKLGMKNIDDVTHQNYPIFQKFQSRFTGA